MFLNCDINREIILHSGYEKIFIPPFTSDTGGAVGAGLYAAFHSLKNIPENKKVFSPYLGPEYKNEEIFTIIKKHSVSYTKLEYPWKKAGEYLRDNKIVGWFQGRVEAGPRALGNRSILANPFSRETRDRLNLKIKGREYFR
ncbi:MAG: carbamoyl transferase, partial [Candidatus Moranbacteria bacterium]|nr:carbamoyl transferase [Candidatus Moranbacteria bacterium]